MFSAAADCWVRQVKTHLKSRVIPLLEFSLGEFGRVKKQGSPCQPGGYEVVLTV